MKNNLSKTELRKKLHTKIVDILDSDTDLHFQTQFANKTLSILQSFVPYKQSNTIFAYYPMRYEASCLSILSHSLDSNKNIFLPKLKNDKIQFCQCTSLNTEDSFIQNSYGIYEPANNNFENILELLNNRDSSPLLIFVPALAYTMQGHRLGRGKAYYDKFLCELLNPHKNRSFSIIFIGLCFSFQIIESIPTESHDIPVDYILCENGIFSCKENTTVCT